MEDVREPSCGRIVHFFPNGCDEHCGKNTAEKVPAIVVKAFGGLTANLSVFPMNPDGTNVLRYSAQHLSKVAKDAEGKPQSAYWDWPEVK